MSTLPNNGNIITEEEIQNLEKIFKNPSISLLDLTRFLYCCESEERDLTNNSRGNYHIDNVEIAYAGIAGICIPLKKVIKNNDMGHPICDNLR